LTKIRQINIGNIKKYCGLLLIFVHLPKSMSKFYRFDNQYFTNSDKIGAGTGVTLNYFLISISKKFNA